jgi:hypothetical protein
MAHSVLSSAAQKSSTGALEKEALVGLLHALIQHMAEKSPDQFPAALRKPASHSSNSINIPTSVTGSILRLHELVMWDSQHLQEESPQ